MEYAVNAATFSRFTHQGQICMSANRILVQKSIYNEFIDKYVAKVSSLKVGDPRDPETIIGPVINDRQAATLEAMIEKGIAEGAKVALKGY